MTKGDWRTIERPGYFGSKRDELAAQWNAEYGEGKWRVAWQWGEQVVPRAVAVKLYEDGYYHFLRDNPDKLEWLIKAASDVYDTDLSNVHSGLEYDLQETAGTHLQDIAIRWAVLRLGRRFQGNHPVEVRGPKSEGAILTPHRVPFHRPERILPLDGVKSYSLHSHWWARHGLENSVEAFYQQNKVLQVRQ